jgi:Putative Ig domain
MACRSIRIGPPNGTGAFIALDEPAVPEIEFNFAALPLAQALDTYSVAVNDDHNVGNPNMPKGCAEANFDYDVAGGTPPYTYTVASGSLPPGLTLDPNTGQISGTPELGDAGNTYPFSICVIDSCGQTACAPDPYQTGCTGAAIPGCGITVSNPYGTYALNASLTSPLAVADVTGTVQFSAWPLPSADYCPGDLYSLGYYEMNGSVTVSETPLMPNVPDLSGTYVLRKRYNLGRRGIFRLPNSHRIRADAVRAL